MAAAAITKVTKVTKVIEVIKVMKVTKSTLVIKGTKVIKVIFRQYINTCSFPLACRHRISIEECFRITERRFEAVI